jgi:hypothetical protein
LINSESDQVLPSLEAQVAASKDPKNDQTSGDHSTFVFGTSSSQQQIAPLVQSIIKEREQREKDKMNRGYPENHGKKKNKQSKQNKQNSGKNTEKKFVKKGSELEKTIEAKEFVPTSNSFSSISYNLQFA